MGVDLDTDKLELSQIFVEFEKNWWNYPHKVSLVDKKKLAKKLIEKRACGSRL